MPVLVRHTAQFGCRYVAQERHLPVSIELANEASLDEARIAARGRDLQMGDLVPCGAAPLPVGVASMQLVVDSYLPPARIVLPASAISTTALVRTS